MNTAPTADHAAKMDRVYRYQRHIYDLTRRFFLIGRDRLLDCMDIRAGQSVLEMGCGTGRNLVKLARRHPEARYFGLDASRIMLDTAQAKIRRAGVEHVRLCACLAETLDHAQTFGETEPFDHIFFSYALSMIPPWRQALRGTVANLKPGGHLHVIDFWDQRDLPSWFRALLVRWLALFHVRHEPGLIACLERLGAGNCGRLAFTPLLRRYAFMASLTDIDSEKAITALQT